MDDFCGKEVFFDRGSFREKPSDHKWDALLVITLEKQTIPLPIMNRSSVLPAIILWEFCILDDFLGDEIQVGNTP
jgi:hypothetical protein